MLLVLILSMALQNPVLEPYHQLQEWIDTGQFSQAERELTRLASQDPASVQVAYFTGLLKWRQSEVVEAEGSFRKALQANPKFVPAYLQLSRLLESQDKEEAIRILNDGLALLPDNADLLLRSATLLAGKRDLTASLGQLERISKGERSAEFLEVRGRIYASLGNFSAAEQDYLHLLESRPQSIPILRALSGFALKQDQVQRGWEYMAEARRIAPNSPEVLYDFARVSSVNGLLAEAANSARLLLLLEPDNDQYNLLLGEILWSDGEPIEAGQRMESYLATRPQDGAGHSLLGRVLFQQGRFLEAEQHLQQARTLNPAVGDSDYYLAMIDYSLARNEEAEASFKGILQRDPNHSAARLALGKLLLSSGRVEEAEPHLTLAARQLPEDPAAHFQLSRLYRQLGDREKAAAALEVYRQLKNAEAAQKKRAAELPFTKPEEARPPESTSPVPESSL